MGFSQLEREHLSEPTFNRDRSDSDDYEDGDEFYAKVRRKVARMGIKSRLDRDRTKKARKQALKLALIERDTVRPLTPLQAAVIKIEHAMKESEARRKAEDAVKRKNRLAREAAQAANQS